MIVKKEPSPLVKIREILIDQNGMIFTSDLAKFGIPRTYLAALLKNGEIRRISRGIYSAANSLVDEMASIQCRYKGAILSHETALYLLGLTDRTPLSYSVTVPAGYNASKLKAHGVKVYYVNRGVLTLGLLEMESPHGNDIKTFNLERTICDVVRSRNQMDVQYLNEALKRYVTHKNRNISQLYDYASQFSIQKMIRDYLEILL